MMSWPFDADVPRNQWRMIAADGFAAAVPGCVYDGALLDGGVPLGGLGTGYFTLEGTGKIGFCSIYNDIVPPQCCFADWLTIRVGQTEAPLSSAQIAYWGHYPVADMVCQFSELPLTLGIRAFSPLVVGNPADSNIPAALFEIGITNGGSEPLEVHLTVTPPQPPAGRVGQVAFLGDGLATTARQDHVEAGCAVTVAPGALQKVRFVFAWHYPRWSDSGGEAHVHRYGTRYADAKAVVQDAWARFDALRDRILAWQDAVYRAELPHWLRDALVQSLYSLAKNTIWIARTRKDEWWDADGWFTHNESHSGCPVTETMVCRMHGHFPTLFFFPDLEVSTLEAFRHFQISDGEIPFSYGMGTAMRDPRYHCQHPLNSGQYAQMVYRLYRRTGKRRVLDHFYESVRRAIRYQFSLDDDDDGLVNDQAHALPGRIWPANQFYDCWPWWGTSAYVAGTWLATLTCGKALAEAVGDAGFAAECVAWLARARNAYQQTLWTGSYYRLWNDVARGRASDVSLGNQLMAQWCVRVAGLPDALPPENVQAALGMVERLNMGATPHGLVNGVTPDGQRYDARAEIMADVSNLNDDDQAKHIFVGENLCAAMTFVYHGKVDTGLEIARRMYEAIALTARAPWNQRCLISSETGLPVWGDDYYSNMVVWALPMALDGQDVGSFAREGGLIDRMIAAATA